MLVFATACGGGQSPTDSTAPIASSVLDPKNPVTITLWHYYVGENQQAIEAAVAEFNQTEGIEKGVIVEAVAKGSIAELEEAVTNSAKGIIGAEVMPDIFSSYPDKAMEIDELGKVCDLNAYFTTDEKNMYVADFLKDGIYSEGRFLLVPIVKSTELFYINKTQWAEFAQSEGLDDSALATWEDVYKTAQAYYLWSDSKTPDVAGDGKAFMGFDSVANFIIVGNKQLGIDVIDGEGQQATLDEAVLRQIFDIYCGGISLGYFDAVGKFRSDDIKSGELVSYVGSSSGAAYFPTWIDNNNTQEDIEFLALNYPAFEKGKSYAIQQGAGMCVANSTPEKQEGAALFLKWFTAKTQNIEFAMTTGYLPVQTEAYESEEFTTVLEELRKGDEAQQNVAAVYEIALKQITELNTYAAKPFAGSYDVRSTLQSTLMNAAELAKTEVDSLRAQGLADEEILTKLDMDARFTAWIADVKAKLDEANIAYK